MTDKSSLIRDLLHPASLPEKTKTVHLVQTHISLVFVADNFVYKIKKAVNFGFLDFSTLEKRRYYCHQEVKLNQRLSKGIYIKVLPIYYDGNKYRVGKGRGDVVEYAVKMRRIPDDKLMKSIFQKGNLTNDHLKQVAEVLGRFHVNALRTPEIDEFGKPERFRVNTDENFDQVEKYMGLSIREGDFKRLKKWTNDFYDSNPNLFLQRIQAGKIRDCHGDLHMEHVCFTENLSVIDCIEFNDRFRYSDTIAEMAFLLMDLEYHGGEGFAKELWEDYKIVSREKESDQLLTFYKVYRAFVRGKVNSFQLDDQAIEPSKKEEAVQSAKRYFQLAISYIDS
ncbi:MAG: phosphotransferase [Pseudomonadota bacterium]